MYMDECCRVNLDSKYAFNNNEKRYTIPHGTPIRYMVKLLNIEKKSARTKREYQQYLRQSRYPK